MRFKSGFNIFQFVCHEENRGKYNYFSKTAFWKKTAVKFAWGYFFLRNLINKRVRKFGGDANKKVGEERRDPTEISKIKKWGICLFGTGESSKTVKYIWICFYLVRH